MPLIDSLRDLEERFWRAAGDVAFYERHLARDARMLFPGTAGPMGRAEVIASMRQASPWTRFRLFGLEAVPLGQDAALLVYRADAERDGRPWRARAASAYVREDGTWKLAFHQQLPDAG